MLDLDQTRRFLRALSLAPDDNVFAFQTVDDPEDEELPHLRKVLNGFFRDLERDLISGNEHRAGIFVTINRTNGQGRKETDIVGLRAVFIDSDDGPIDPKLFSIQPNIIVTTKHGQHAYWLLEQGEDRSAFRGVQIALAKHFGTDPSIKDLPRVMRLPGFLHHKSEPFLVTLDCCDEEPRHTIAEIIDAFSLTIEEEKRVVTAGPSKDIGKYGDKLKRCEAYLQRMPLYAGVSSNRSDACYKVSATCGDFAVLGGEKQALVDRWNSRNSDPLKDHEIAKVINNEIKHRKNQVGCKLDRPDFGGPIDENPPEHKGWEDRRRDGDKDSTIGLSGKPPRIGPPEDPDGWENSINAPSPDYEEEERHSFKQSRRRKGKESGSTRVVIDDGSDEEVNESAKDDEERIGVSAEDASREDRLIYCDSEMKPYLISKRLIDEYEIRREDSGAVYLYANSRWNQTTDKLIRRLAHQYTTMNKATPKTIAAAVSGALDRRHFNRIEWNQLKDEEIPLKNGVLNFMTGEIRGHDHKDYLERYAPFDYSPSETCPIFEQCLEDWLPGMDQEKSALQEFFGYCLMAHARYKKALMLYGGPNTGKSQVCKVVQELVGGSDFTCSIYPDSMNDPRALAPIKGKAINIIYDLPKNSTLQDGGFKQLVSTGETISIDPKNIHPEQYTPSCKHIFATNNLPTISDSTDAVYTRLLLIHFDHAVPESKQDPLLQEKFEKEMPGILNWAIEGARRLYSSNGRWGVVKSSQEMIAEYKRMQNPVHDFIEESGWVIKDDEGSISIHELRMLFNNYHGTRPWTKKAIRERISSLGYKESRVGTKRGVRGLRESDEIRKAREIRERAANSDQVNLPGFDNTSDTDRALRRRRY